MSKIHYEDIIMKRAMDIFAESGLKFFGIYKKVKEVAPTELVTLDIHKNYMDYTFLMEDDTYIHFEFQTTNKNTADMRRFRMYEAHLSYQTGKDVVTYVVYTNNIESINDTLKTGINTYKINAIYMADWNSDEIFATIQDKIAKSIVLTQEDILSLAFTPVMGGKTSQRDRILETIELSKNIEATYRHDVESIIFAFANKFLTGKELEEVKEVLKMTELGKSLWSEGLQEGILQGEMRGEERGEEKAKKEIIAHMLKNGLSDELIATMTGVALEEVKTIKNMP
jgi:predicted transposase/invertase (TIGR01784 family)